MNILIATFSFFPETNGVANVVLEHARYFLAQGHSVTIATTKTMDREESSYGDIKVIEFELSGGPLPWNFYKGDIRGYIKFLDKPDYDVVMFHGWQIWSTDLFLFSKIHKESIKKIFVSHGAPISVWTTFSEFLRALLLIPYRRIVIPMLMKRFDNLVFLSDKDGGDRQWDYRYARDNFGEKVSIVPNGIPAIDFDSATHDDLMELSWIDDKHPIIVYVANYDRVKNHELALDVFEEIAVSHKCTLIFVGSSHNKLSRAMIRKVREKGLGEKVFILEKLTKSQIYKLLSMSFMTLFTSRSECYPLAVLESIAYKKPVVALDVGAVSEIPGVTICYDKESLIKACQALLFDSELYLSKVMEIEKSYEELKWPHVMKGYDAVLDNKHNEGQMSHEAVL